MPEGCLSVTATYIQPSFMKILCLGPVSSWQVFFSILTENFLNSSIIIFLDLCSGLLLTTEPLPLFWLMAMADPRLPERDLTCCEFGAFLTSSIRCPNEEPLPVEGSGSGILSF